MNFRTWIITIAAVTCWAGSSCAQQKATVSDLTALRASSNQSNTHLVRALAQQADEDLGPRAYTGIVDPRDSRLSNFGPSLSEIAAQAQKSTQTYDTGNMILKGNDLLVKGAVVGGIALAPATGGASLAASAIGAGAELALTQVENLYQKGAEDAIRRNLKTQLDRYEHKYGHEEYAQLTSSTDPARFREQLNEKLGPIFGSDLDELPKEQQDIVNHFYDKQIADVMKAGFASLSGVQDLQQSDIDQNRQDIKGLALTFAHFADSTHQQLLAITGNQEQLNSDLQALDRRVGNTEQGVAFMQSVMFSNMKPADQLTALQSGLFPNMPKNQRKDLEAKIKVVAERKELTDSVKNYLDGASEFVIIARNLGVDPKILNAANQAVSIGNQAATAFTDLTSGNLLGAVGAITNIFGIGGPDVAAQRHAETMNMLRTMYTKLDVIDQKADQLLNGQRVIVQTEQAILEHLDALSKQVQQNQEEVMAGLRSLHDDVLVNRQFLENQASLNYGNCYVLVKDPENGSVIIDTGKGQYPSYSRFQALFTNRRHEMMSCMKQLRATRGASQEFNSVFWLKSAMTSVNSNIGAYLTKVYDPAWELLQNTSLNADGKTLAQRVSSLLVPMSTVADFSAKYSGVEAVDPPRFRKSLSDLMATALAPPAVILHDSYLANIHYYFLLLDAEDRPRPLQDLYSVDDIRLTGCDYLIDALSLTDVAIAQQVLVSGDSLLPIMADGLERFRDSQDANRAKTYNQISDLLKNDSILASNLMKYMLRKQVLSKCNLIVYNVALTRSDPTLLNGCVADFWKLSYSEKEVKDDQGILETPRGWSVNIGGTQYALPSAVDLLDGKFVYTNETYGLLGWRQRILQEISTYQVYDGASAGLRSDIDSVILKQFASPAEPPTN